jgi:hypothetical protein
MLEKQIENMKLQLDHLILTEPFSSPTILSYSQALDELIVEFMKRKASQKTSGI